MKVMQLMINDQKVDLLIERDKDNFVRVLMGSKKQDIKRNWTKLSKLCQKALKELNTWR